VVNRSEEVSSAQLRWHRKFGQAATQPGDCHQARSAPTNSYLRRLSRLAFLAPDLQQAVLDGRQPVAMTLQNLVSAELPLGWGDQRRMFMP
jgi:hypothetical protein